MTKIARELKRMEIRNAGSLKEPVNLLGVSKTRSGRRFRAKKLVQAYEEDSEEMSEDFLLPLFLPILEPVIDQLPV